MHGGFLGARTAIVSASLAAVAVCSAASACVAQSTPAPAPACDASPSTLTPTPTPEGGDAAMFCAYQACQVMTAADVTQAMGVPFPTAIQGDTTTSVSPSGSTDFGEVTCGYVGDGVGAVFFAIACNGQPYDPMPPPYDAGVVSVPGAEVGYWTEGELYGDDQLVVFVDSYRDLVVTLSPMDGGTFPVDPLSAATRIAAVAISRL